MFLCSSVSFLNRYPALRFTWNRLSRNSIFNESAIRIEKIAQMALLDTAKTNLISNTLRIGLFKTVT